MPGPLYTCVAQSLEVGCPREGMISGEVMLSIAEAESEDADS